MEKRFRLKDKKSGVTTFHREIIVRLFCEHSGGITVLPSIMIADYSAIFRFRWIRFQFVVILHYTY